MLRKAKLSWSTAARQFFVASWYTFVHALACSTRAIQFWKPTLEDHVHRFKFGKADFLGNLKLKPKEQRAKGHPHPHCAENRASFLDAVRGMCEALGMCPYYVSPGRREVLHGEDHDRTHYWPRDLTLPAHRDDLRPDHVIVMTDVDYYVDVNQYLETGLPIVMYTFVPEKAAFKNEEFSYRFEEGHKLKFESNGGFRVDHELWDYDHDDFTVRSVLGFVTNYETFMVRMDTCRYLVGLVPRYQVDEEVFGFEERRVERWHPCVNRAVLVPDREEPGKLSVAMIGSLYYQAFSFSREQFAAIAKRLTGERADKASTLSDLTRLLESREWCKRGVSMEAATVLAEYYGVLSIQDASQPDWYSYGPEADGKVVGQLVAPSLTNAPNLAPSRSESNEKATIDERIYRPANKKVPPAVYRCYAREFAEFVVPDDLAHKGTPLDLLETMDLQTKPNQKKRNERYGPWVSFPKLDEKVTVRAFQKAETYPNPKAPRNISTVPYDHQITLSSYTLAMKDVLKRCPWFMSGLEPREISDRVHELADRGDVMCRDFSSFDATVSEWLTYNVCVACAERWVSPQHLTRFSKLLKREVGCDGFTKLGQHYVTGSSRLTGSPVTSDHNTLINAFSSYSVFRRAGLSPADAWSKLGAYYGDDSVDNLPESLDSTHSLVMSELGLKAKVERPIVGDPIPFLGRYYYGGGSICDPHRVMRKIHYSASSLPPKQALANKAQGYFITDSGTPVVGTWCRKVLELLKEEAVEPDYDTMTSEEAWRVTQAHPAPADPMEPFCLVTGWSVAEVLELDAMIRKARSLAELPEEAADAPDYGRYPDCYVNSDLQTMDLPPDPPEPPCLPTPQDIEYWASRSWEGLTGDILRDLTSNGGYRVAVRYPERLYVYGTAGPILVGLCCAAGRYFEYYDDDMRRLYRGNVFSLSQHAREECEEKCEEKAGQKGEASGRASGAATVPAGGRACAKPAGASIGKGDVHKRNLRRDAGQCAVVGGRIEDCEPVDLRPNGVVRQVPLRRGGAGMVTIGVQTSVRPNSDVVRSDVTGARDRKRRGASCEFPQSAKSGERGAQAPRLAVSAGSLSVVSHGVNGNGGGSGIGLSPAAAGGAASNRERDGDGGLVVDELHARSQRPDRHQGRNGKRKRTRARADRCPVTPGADKVAGVRLPAPDDDTRVNQGELLPGQRPLATCITSSDSSGGKRKRRAGRRHRRPRRALGPSGADGVAVERSVANAD